MNDDELMELEDAFFSLTGQIDYGDISNMDIYWDGMSSAVQGLSIKQWNKPSKSDFVDLLKSLPNGLAPADFIEIIEEMVRGTDKSSDDTFEPRELKRLRTLADQAEGLFNEFIDNLKGCDCD